MHLARGATEKGKVFLKAEREWRKKEIVSQECIVLGKGQPPEGNRRGPSADYLIVLTKRFHLCWLKVTFLGLGLG